MKTQILMNDKIVIEPNSETERYAIMKLLDCIGDKKLKDVIEVEIQNLFEGYQNG